jgi:hypothetical protein
MESISRKLKNKTLVILKAKLLWFGSFVSTFAIHAKNDKHT